MPSFLYPACTRLLFTDLVGSRAQRFLQTFISMDLGCAYVHCIWFESEHPVHAASVVPRGAVERRAAEAPAAFGGGRGEATRAGEREGVRLGLVRFCKVDMAMVQSHWHHFGIGALPILAYFGGDWDVHWGYRVLTHGHMVSE